MTKNIDGGSKLKVALMGPDIDHKHSLLTMLGEQGCVASWMPDSFSMSSSAALSAAGRLRRAFDQLTYTRNQAFVSNACRHIDEMSADVVVAYWGTNPLPDIIALKRQRPHVRFVLMVLCYPLTLTNVGVMRQNWMMHRAARWLDGVLFPSPEMAGYFESTVFGRRGHNPASTILWPCWPASYQAGERAGPVSDRPNLIFAGRTDLSHHTVHAADDLRPLMKEILEAGIELHHVRSPETTDGHPLRRPFAPMSQAQLIATMATYDASLIAYNTDACQRAERFEFTVPDRLITSVAAGVPIAVPRKGYGGCKAYLAQCGAPLFEFDTPADLYKQLSDRARVQEVRDAAWAARPRYTAEAQGEALVRFLRSLT